MIIFGYKIYPMFILIVVLALIVLIGLIIGIRKILKNTNKSHKKKVKNKNFKYPITGWQKKNLVTLLENSLDSELEQYGENQLTEIYQDWIEFVKYEKEWKIPTDMIRDTIYINDLILEKLKEIIYVENPEDIKYNRIVLWVHTIDCINNGLENGAENWIDTIFEEDELYEYKDKNLNRLRTLLYELISNYYNTINEDEEFIPLSIKFISDEVKRISKTDFLLIQEKLEDTVNFLEDLDDIMIHKILFMLLNKCNGCINNMISGNVLTQENLSYFRAMACFADQQSYKDILKSIEN